MPLLLHMPQGGGGEGVGVVAAVLFLTLTVLPTLLVFFLFFFFSFSRSLPASLSPSSCPLLCKPSNFSLQWENRYNGGESASLFNKGIEARRRDESREKEKNGSTLGAGNK